jgi:hypothetical protein
LTLFRAHSRAFSTPSKKICLSHICHKSSPARELDGRSSGMMNGPFVGVMQWHGTLKSGRSA